MNALLAAYPDSPAWFELALTFNGMHELLADGTLEPRVRGLFEHTHFPPKLVNEKTAWCAAFACSMLERSGYKSPQSAAAHDFLKWGVERTPRIGAFVVLPRDGGFHVTMWAGNAGSEKFLGYGGNQQNKVCMQLYDRVRPLGYRWPA